MISRVVLTFAVFAFASSCQSRAQRELKTPIVIGHRGASGYRPEHTIESYRLAIEQGADFIEPDLVKTKDGVLIARHENEISETTDAPQKFPARKVTKTVDGKQITGWFTEDFTLAEIKTLRAKERLPARNHAFDGQFQIPTFAEILAMVNFESNDRKRAIGVYPETKHPSYFKSIQLPLEDDLLRELERGGYVGREHLVFIQSFEVNNLKYLRSRSKYALVQLISDPREPPFDVQTTYGEMLTPAGLREIAKYAAGIGPSKLLLLQLQSSGEFKKVSDLVNEAHAAGLVVHPWTFRVEEVKKIAPQIDPKQELRELYKLGIDGVFSDFPDLAIQVAHEK